MNYVGECGAENYKCGRCEGDCDYDSDCEDGLICFRRDGFETVPGCTGAGGSRDVKGKDFCISKGQTSTPAVMPSSMPTTQMAELRVGPYEYSLRYYSSQICNTTNPCDRCTGWCSSDSDCALGLSCFTRNGNEPIPGCVTGGVGDISGKNYCYAAPQKGPVTFIPGEFTISENGLSLSTGLTSRLIAKSLSKVSYQDGGQSTTTYLSKPDFGTTFSITSGVNAGG